MKADLPTRGNDEFGSGAYKASRGKRKHEGIDFSCPPDTGIYSDVEGIVTKVGYPYGDDLSFRYVRVKTNKGYEVDYFYVQPTEKAHVGRLITKNDIIGISQSLQKRYPGITDHVHFQVKYNGVYADPEQFLETL